MATPKRRRRQRRYCRNTPEPRASAAAKKISQANTSWRVGRDSREEAKRKKSGYDIIVYGTAPLDFTAHSQPLREPGGSKQQPLGKKKKRSVASPFKTCVGSDHCSGYVGFQNPFSQRVSASRAYVAKRRRFPFTPNENKNVTFLVLPLS